MCNLHTFFYASNGILEVWILCAARRKGGRQKGRKDNTSKEKTELSVRERGGRTAVGEGGVQERSVR